MGRFDENRFESANQEWETPDDLFAALDRIFGFTRDVCASPDNAKVVDFWTEEDDCLTKTWDGICWMNPPYKDMKRFISKAFDERENATTVCLIPARTNTNWWHDWCMKGEVWFIRGRPKFKGNVHGLPQPLALVVFGRERGTMKSFDLKNLAVETA